MAQFEYINRAYRLSMRRGSAVEYTGDKGTPKRGFVTSADGGYINIRFVGEKRTRGPFHPTWEMRHLGKEPTP